MHAHGAHEFLRNLALVLCVAGVTTVICHRLRQPVVLGYLLAGLIIGPHLPIPLVGDTETIDALAELGVILLLFSLGLELSVRRLIRVGAAAALVAVVQVSVMLGIGYATARALGWGARESLFTGSMLCISSTTIIARAFDEERVSGRLRSLVLGVLVVEDLVAILLLAVLTTVGAGGAGAVSWRTIGGTAARLFGFLVGLGVVGMLVVPRSMRAIVRMGRAELTLVSSIGLCFAAALLARSLGYSVALGAFLAGALVAESGEGHVIEPLVAPVRDLFAAVFFVAVGMMIDPALVVKHWGAILILTTVVVLGKLSGVTLGAFLSGAGVRTSIAAGLSMAQIGEMSFLVAGLGMSLGATGERLYAIAVAVSALTTLLTPWLIRASGPVAARVDRALPPPLQTFAALYGSWIERLSAPRSAQAGGAVGRLVRGLALDAVLACAIVIAGARVRLPLAAWLQAHTGIPAAVARALPMLLALTLAAPFLLGLLRLSRRLGERLAERAIPLVPKTQADPGLQPRRALARALELFIALLWGAPLTALTQPFLAPYDREGLLLLGLMLAGLAVAVWRAARNLEGHVQAGAQVVAELLAAQSHDPAGPLARVEEALPGLGHPEAVRVPEGSPAIGLTLGELHLRGRTGATVLAIRRGDSEGAHEIVLPSAHERLRSGDLLALAGSDEAIAAARAALAPPPPSDSEPSTQVPDEEKREHERA